MIKPKNDQSIKTWDARTWFAESLAYDKLPEGVKWWSCDCCGKTGTDNPMGSFAFPFGTVCVAGLTYLGCSIDCVRALFTIHHQYALSALLDAKLPAGGAAMSGGH